MKIKKKKTGCLVVIVIVAVIAIAIKVLSGNSKQTDVHESPSDHTIAVTKNQTVSETEAQQTTAEETVLSESESNTEEAADDPSALENVIRPEFKEFMDSYEAFYDEYIDFMERYKNADSSNMLAMMTDYMNYLEKYSEFTEKLDAIDENELTDAEALYYAEVTLRVSQKMLQAAY